MVVTYALTMSALQQAHTTKKNRYTRRQKMHAVINLATMAMRWKRAVNNDLADEQKVPHVAGALKPDGKSQTRISISDANQGQRKRATSLLEAGQYPPAKKGLSKRMFISNYRLSEPLAPISWHKRREKQLQPLVEKSGKRRSTSVALGSQWISSIVEQPSPLATRHLNPGSPTAVTTPAKRSHSCTPLLDAEENRKNRRRRSSSAHTILQIRRDSAKIREELAKLTAQLSAAMNTETSPPKRLSLSVPGAPNTDPHETPTIDQLLAESTINQPIVIPTSYLIVDCNLAPNNHQLHFGRS